MEMRGENLSDLLTEMEKQNFPFVLDIGTRPGDLDERRQIVQAASGLCANTGNGIPRYLHFSCGLWPDGPVIADRKNALSALEADIQKMRARDVEFASLGECGLDRYWNGPAAAERIAALEKMSESERTAAASDDGPGTTDLAGEEELFEMQLDLAQRYALPVIVHSRDAFEATLGCIRNGGWDTGVIHCFSYGVAEARAFLDRGWYISFLGNITWPKRDADKERIATLVRYVPRDRLLLETDAPYMTPAPYRGKTNTPLLIENTYNRAAAILNIEVSALARLVYENACTLFHRADK